MMLLVALLAATACDAAPSAAPSAPAGAAPSDAAVPDEQAAKPDQASKPEAAKPRPARRIDPRKGGFEIALGEWAVTPETESVRPGPVTFLISNRGTMPHGFEIELEGDSGGHGSGDLFKQESELLQPGESTRMTVDLGPGVYKIECLVDGHDDMGMEAPLPVRPGAALLKVRPQAPDDTVTIDDFAFAPITIETEAGAEVTWSNSDAAPHTVTSTTDVFGSDTLDPGDAFSFTFEEPGIYPYRCEIHPDMKGEVRVE